MCEERSYFIFAHKWPFQLKEDVKKIQVRDWFEAKNNWAQSISRLAYLTSQEKRSVVTKDDEKEKSEN